MLALIYNNFKRNLIVMVTGDILIVAFALFISLQIRFDFNIPDKVFSLLTVQTIMIFSIIKVITF